MAPMRHIDPYSLQLLMSVGSARSIAKAAAREHIAPSALSRRIADLERVLGVPLVVRTPHGISLTEAGEIAVQRAAEIEQELRSLVRETQGHGGRIAGTVRLYASAAAFVGFLPARLKQFLDRHRQVTVNLQERLADEVIHACLDDRADVGIAEAVEAPGTIESWHFAADPLVVELPPGHPLEKKERLRLCDLLPYPMVSILPGGAIDRLLHEHATKNGGQMRVCVTVFSYDAGCRMVEEGFGLAVKPKSAAEAYAVRRQLVSRPLDEDWAGNEQRVYALRAAPRLRTVDALIQALQG